MLFLLLVLFGSLALATEVQDAEAPPESVPVLVNPIVPVVTPAPSDTDFKWGSALTQSMRFLFLEHGFRLAFQPETRSRLRGPFWSDYAKSVKSTAGWGDGDHWFLNYVAHPMQGTMSGYIQVQNDPGGRTQVFGKNRAYWQSRLKALAWNAAYSTQFEVGPVSESSLGNVGMRKGTSGYVDHVMTPSGGFAVMLTEDALDRFVIQKWEQRTQNITLRTFYRIALNPCRSFANVLRGKGPWHRDTRPLVRPLSN